MKKLFLKFMCFLLALFAFPLTGAAETLTVADNSATNSDIPVCCNYFDGNTMSQTIYSATLLHDVVGQKITSIKYHASSALASKLAGAVLQISTGETTESTIPGDGSYYDYGVLLTGLTENGTYTVQGGETEIEFILNEPIIFSGNKNLAVEVKLLGSFSQYSSVNWKGENQEGKVSVYARGYSNPSNNKSLFMPKTTFTHEAASTDPTIKVEPETVTINTDPYTAGTATFTVTGTNLINDINLSVSGSGFSVNPTPITAAEAANGKSVLVTYSAQEAGTFSGTITLSSTGAESKTVNVTANVVQPVISGTVTPTSLNFETYAGVAATQTISIENTGNKAFTPTFTVPAPFSIAAATEIAVGETKTFDVTYTPTAVGTDNGTLTVTINNTPTNVTLNGTANEAPKELTIAENGTATSYHIPITGNYFDNDNDFGQTIYNKSNLGLLAGKNITKVKYYSNSALQANLAGIELEIYLMETPLDEIEFNDDTFRYVPFEFTGSPNGTYTITGNEGKELEFNLSTSFAYSGNNNLVVQLKVKTKGRYQNIPWLGQSADKTIGYYAYSTSTTGHEDFLPKTTFSYEDSETPATPVITVDPATVDAFTTEVGTPATATVNVTGENLTDDITAIVSGENADCFTAALENGVLTITYNPTAAGNHTATLTLSSTGAQDVTIALTGTATAQPYAVTVNPENGYDFGKVLVDNTKVWTLTVTNNGLNAVTPTLSGLEAPFSTNYTAAALAAGESVSIEITFAPTEVNDYSNTITLSFPEANGAIADYTFELTGKGVDSFEPTADNEVVKLVTVDKRSIYVPDFVDPNPEHSQTPQQLNCYDMRFRMAQPDDPAKQIKAGDLRPGDNLYEFYAIGDFGTEFRFATINLSAEGQTPAPGSTHALEAPITVTPSVTYYTEEGMPIHPTFSHNTTLNYTEKTYNSVDELVDLEGVIDYVNDTWSANTAANAHPDHYKFQVRGVGQFGDLITSLTAEYVKTHMTGYGGMLVLPEGWDRGSYAGPNNELDNIDTYYYYDLYIKRSFFEERGITGPVTVVVNTTLSGSGFNADNYKAMSVNGVEQIIAKEAYKDYSWTVPLGNDLPENTIVEQVPMGVVIKLVSTGADFNKTRYINIYGGTTGVSNIDTVNIYKSSMNVKAYTQKQVDEDTDRNLVAMKNGGTETSSADVNVLAYADPAVTGYKLYENSSASTTGMTTPVATATHNSDGSYSVNSVSQYTDTYPYVRDESLGNIDGMWLPMYPADPSKYFLPVTVANGVGDDGVVRSQGNTYGSAMQQVQENGSISFDESECVKSEYTWTQDGVTYAIYNPDVLISSSFPTGYQLYNYRLWVDYEDDAPAWDFEKTADGKINLTEKMDRPLYEGMEISIGGESPNKESWTFVAPADLTSVKLVARCYYKKISTASNAPVLKARPTDSDRLYYVVESQETVPTNKIVTGIYNVTAKNVVSVKYYNVQGVESATPFDGINIEVTTYDDGTRTTRKVLR